MSDSSPSPHVEVWRSIQAWETLPRERRDEVLRELAAVVGHHWSGPATECGPFVRRGRDGVVLVWQVDYEFRQALLSEYERLELPTLFSRIMFGDSPDLSAREIAAGFSSR